jgi:hypothetical protein
MSDTTQERLERADPVIKALHKAKPDRVRVVERGGGTKEVRLSRGRNRWRALADVLDTLAWERVEGLDAEGAVVCCVTQEDDDGDDAAPESVGSARVDDVGALVRMMAKVQSDTLREARSIYAAQAEAMARVLDSATESLRTAQEAFDMALKVQAATLARGGGEEGAQGVGVAEMLQMAMMLGNAPKRPPPQAPLKAVPKEGA